MRLRGVPRKRAYDVVDGQRQYGPTLRVAVFGAGIAGLTAAHELAERGFAVDVFEPTPATPFEPECSVGGMARTQWARAERIDPRSNAEGRRRVYMHRRAELPTSEQELRMKRPIQFGSHKGLVPAHDDQLNELVGVLQKIQAPLKIWVWGYGDGTADCPSFEALDRDDYRRAKAVADSLQEALKDKQPRIEFTAVAGGYGCPNARDKSNEERCYVELDIAEDWLPGEHGFRFFPSFYRNLRDTLRRIPIAADGEAFAETPWSVHDNLVATTSQGINPDNGHAFILPRSQVVSPQRFFDIVLQALRGTPFSSYDMSLIQLKLFKFITSCGARRAQYARLSWWDFVEGHRYSPAFQESLDKLPQNLVSMSAQECDARTYGNMQTQILADQFSSGETTDSTLNAPTTIAWFRHWRRYLESQGVMLRCGAITGFHHASDGTTWPIVRLEEENKDGSRSAQERVMEYDYCVLALPLDVMRELADKDPKLGGEDFDRVRRMTLGNPSAAKPDGVLQHMSGIQYYFDGEIKFLPGHTVYADSDWGLSSIFQPQFWRSKRGWWDGYRGVLSVDISDWFTKSRVTGKCAWDSTEPEIAHEVWRQIKATVKNAAVPPYTMYHFDENIVFERDDGAGRMLPARNLTRMLICLPGRYEQRPGQPGAYQMQMGRFVMAGTFMQTYSRITSMEAANESARHAVNAILEAAKYPADKCVTADPEKHEFDDLKYLVDLDAELHRRGLPHFIDILSVDRMPQSLLGGLAGLGPLIERLVMPYARSRRNSDVTQS